MHKIIESVELHDTLNPKIWVGYELRDEVKEKLNEIVDKFILELHENDIPVKVLDARLVGSNASFNYTENSDLDVHIIANFEDTSCDVPVLSLLYNFFKKNFNDKYDISIHGVPVELYVEDMNSSAVSNGVYSLFKDEWVKMPEPIEIPDIDITDEFTVYEDKYNKVMSNNDAENASDLVDELYLLRKDSISTDGEYGVGNLVFKEFRNRGYLNNLKQLMVDETSKELSLEHLNESQLEVSTAYMLNNKGDLIQCGLIHPYIKYIIQNSNKKEIESLFNDRLNDLLWFYKNTKNNEIKDDINALVNSVISNTNYNIKEEIKEKCGIEFNIVDDNKTEHEDIIEDLFSNINDECNQEFCRVRTSHMRAPIGKSKDIYFRISSVGFNWFNTIWKVVMDNENFIESVTICTDTQATGKSIQFYSHNGEKINQMPVEEFINLPGNPIIESNQDIYSMLEKGLPLNECFGQVSPIHVNRCVEKLRNIQFENNNFELYKKSNVKNQILESKADEQRLIDFVGEETAQKFFKLKPRIKSPQNDLYYWLKREPVELQDFLNDLESTKSKTQIEREAKQGAKLLYNKNGWKIYRIDTYEAATYYGKNTKWCISGNYPGSEGQGQEYFDDYKNNGVIDYYFIISPDNHKWCYLHTEDGFKDSVLWNEVDDGFTDIRDDEIPDFPADAMEVMPGFKEHFKVMTTSEQRLRSDVIRTHVLDYTEETRDILKNYSTVNKPTWLTDYVDKLIIHKDCETVRNEEFLYMDHVQEIIIEDGITEIGVASFALCIRLTKVYIPNTIKTIFSKAFAGCFDLKKIYIPSSVEYIGESAFARCNDDLTIYCGIEEEKTIDKYNEIWNIKDMAGDIKDPYNYYDCLFNVKRTAVESITEDVYDKDGYYNPDQDSRYKRLLRTPINKLTRDDIAYLYTIHFTKYSDGYNDNGTQHTYWYARDEFGKLLEEQEEIHGDDFDRTYLFTSNLSFPLTVYRAIRTDEKNKNSISGKDGSLSWTTDINIYKKDNSMFKNAADIVSAQITPDMIQNEWTVVNYVLYSARPSYGRYAESEITLKPRFKMDKLQNLKFIDKNEINERFVNEELKTKEWAVKQFSDAFLSYTPSQSLLKAKLNNITDGEWEDVIDFVNSLKFPLIIYRGLKLKDINELNTSELGVNWTIDDELFFAPESAFYDSNYIIVTKITEDAIDYPETIQNYIYYSLRPQEGRWAESEITVKKDFKPSKYYILKKENDELVPVN